MPGKIPLLSTLFLTACSVVGVRSGTEEPPYTVIAHQGSAEIRQYGPRIAAQTTVDTTNEINARGTGFRRLAAYIFGANTTKSSIAMTAPVSQASETIAMTAPVATDRTNAGWTIRFFMPAHYTLETLPKPNDPKIQLVQVPPQTTAVIRFTGTTAPDAVATHQADLLQALSNSKWQPAGAPAAWFYDPPWTLPFLRRNEVAVPVQPAGVT